MGSEVVNKIPGYPNLTFGKRQQRQSGSDVKMFSSIYTSVLRGQQYLHMLSGDHQWGFWSYAVADVHQMTRSMLKKKELFCPFSNT